MPLTSSVVNKLITNFKLYCCSKKFQMLQKNVKSLLEQLKVCIFAEIVFGVKCTLKCMINDRVKLYYCTFSFPSRMQGRKLPCYTVQCLRSTFGDEEME